jgi:hypothetical protein
VAALEADAQTQDEQRRRESIEKDPKVREIVDMFQGEVVADSIKPTTNGPADQA